MHSIGTTVGRTRLVSSSRRDATRTSVHVDRSTDRSTMFRAVKDAARASASASASASPSTGEATTSSSSGCSRVPLKIDLDSTNPAMKDGSAEAEPRIAGHYGMDSFTTVSWVRHQGLILCFGSHGAKAFGALGLEALYGSDKGECETRFSEARCGGFVSRASRVFRLGEYGDLAVWDARNQRLLASGCVDEARCVEAVRGTNFFLCGSSTGEVSVWTVGVDGKGRGAIVKRDGYALTAQQVLSRVVNGANGVVALKSQPGQEYAAVLIAFVDGSLALWHLHERKSLAVTAPSTVTDVGEDDGVMLTCADWLDASTIVAGYSDGVIKLFRVTGFGGSITHEIKEQQSVKPHLLINPSYKGSCMAIRSVKTFISDDDDVNRDCSTWITLCGGEPIACPDPVICVRATRVKGSPYRIERAGAIALPWFGPVLDAVPVPFRDGVESVCVLSEGSQLHMHDVRFSAINGEDDRRPHEVMLMRPALSGRCPPSACAAASEVVDAFLHNATTLNIPRQEIDPSYGWKGSKWPLHGGEGPRSSEALLPRIIVSAHGRNGSGVRIYLESGGRLVSGGHFVTGDDPISSLYVDAGGALLVVGRVSGKVEIHALRKYPDGDRNDRDRVHVRELSKSEAESVAEEAAFHSEISRDFIDSDSSATCMTSVYTLIGTYTSELHKGKDVTRLKCNAAATFLAVGDSRGGTSLLDLQRGSFAWAALPAEESAEATVMAIRDFEFGLPLPDFPGENVLAILDARSSVRFLSLSRGAQMGKTMHPKSPTDALAIALQRLDGSPSDIIPPRAVASSWFAPPKTFAYSFLAAEFVVEEDDVDEEENVLSTDEEECEERLSNSIPKYTALVITVAKEAVRVYHAVGCSRGERHALRKSRLDEPFVSASFVRGDEGTDAFGHGRGSTSLIAITEYGRMCSFDTPSLKSGAMCGPLPSMSNMDTACVSRGGAAVVVADDGMSIARYETFGTAVPADGSVVDQEVESAAEAACAAREAMEENDPALAIGTSPRKEIPPLTTSSASPASAKKTMLTMGQAFRDRARNAFEKLEKLATTPPKAEADRKLQRRKFTTTDVAMLFAETRIEDPPETTTVASKERQELFSTRFPTSTTKAAAAEPVRHTASDVKAKYGRVSEVKSQMSETRDMLVERGERLERLSDKSAALENDAANFAEMCKQIRKKSESSWL